jgi:hypothetical protein
MAETEGVTNSVNKEMDDYVKDRKIYASQTISIIDSQIKVEELSLTDN